MNKKIKIGLIILIIVILVICYFTFFRTYTVMFNSQGGTWFQAQEVRINKHVEDPGEPILIGYKFLGWYEGNELYDFSKPVKKDITLTAKWEKIEQEK